MTPIRSSMSKTFSDLRLANQTSNGVYPVRPHLAVWGSLVALEILNDFGTNVTVKMKAEV